MSYKSIRFDVLRLVVADMDRRFVTKDVSENERMRQAHPVLVLNKQYHGFVGRALSDNCVELGISEIRKHTLRGSLWEKQQGIECRAPNVGEDLPQTAEPDGSGVWLTGPQYKGDKPFAKRMRYHQSWYRAHVLGLDYGIGPSPSSKSRYGNMLTEADGAAGRNFLTVEIAQVARERVAISSGAINRYRLFHNMLSSQPMCFNLFGPLVKDHALASRLLTKIVPDEIAEVTDVKLEYAPEPANEYLGDRTAFDAFVEYKTSDGRLYALGVETKLTEPFSQKQYDTERYRCWMRVQGAPWRPDAYPQVRLIAHNQLWRDHLLAVAMRYHSQSQYAKVRLMVVHHPADLECVGVIEGYRRLLRDDDDTILDWPLDRLHATWSAALGASPYSDWLREFGIRYLELDRSADASCAS